MIAEFKVNGILHRFRLSFLSNKEEPTKFNYQLNCISEEPTFEYKDKVIPHQKFKDAVKSGKIKMIV